jgi:glycosyltransferase involved in cell wall biosynthesis
MGMDKENLLISIVIPAFNEEENIDELYERLIRSLKDLKFEIILVDDGSTDRTWEKICDLSKKDRRVKGIRFGRNFGQTPALSAGIEMAEGDIIITLDADLQNHPEDIPKLLKEIEDCDVVSGWRKERKEPFFKRRLPSMIANFIIRLLLGIKIHDIGCTLKAYRKNFIKGLPLYGEMHRFIPVFSLWRGAKIKEIPVGHSERKRGKSKYGITRTFKVLLDIFFLKFMASYSTRPIHFFGIPSLLLMTAGILTGVYTLYQKYALGVFAHKNPLLLLSVFLFLIGFQFLMIGIIAELIIRIYHSIPPNRTYFIREKIGFKNEDS